MPTESAFDIEQIKELKAKGLNQNQIALEIGCTQTNVSVLCKKHGIYWDRGAAARDQRGEKNPNYVNGMGLSTVARATRRAVLSINKCLHTCERCGQFDKWKDQPRHHKDRDRSNNAPSNIEVLCVGCHNQEHMAEHERDQMGRFVT